VVKPWRKSAMVRIPGKTIARNDFAINGFAGAFVFYRTEYVG
jgi:hypothetical protein